MSNDTTTLNLTCGSPRNGDRSQLCSLARDHVGEHRGDNGMAWFNYGPLQSYEITWNSGHVETIGAHQVTYSQDSAPASQNPTRVPLVRFDAEIDGRWGLVLAAREEDIQTVRNVTGGERL